MTVTIKGRDDAHGIDYEVSGSAPGPVIKQWCDLLAELDEDADMNLEPAAAPVMPATASPMTQERYDREMGSAPRKSTIAEVKKPENPGKVFTPGSGDPHHCGTCGASSDDGAKIARLDGIFQCSTCFKASKAMAERVAPEGAPEVETPAPAAVPPKAVPKPPATVPAPQPTGKTCEGCGKVLEASEERTSNLFCGKSLCRRCIQAV